MQIRLAFPNEIDQIMLLIEEARARVPKLLKQEVINGKKKMDTLIVTILLMIS